MPSLKLVLIRHGESEDNVILHRMMADIENGVVSRKEGVALFMRTRKTDPALTPRGQQQARSLGAYLAPAVEALQQEGDVQMVCGPMLRNLQTMQQIRSAFAQPPKVTCHRHVYEIQNLVNQKDDTASPPGGMTPQYIRSHYNVDLEGFAEEDRPWSSGEYHKPAIQKGQAELLAGLLAEKAVGLTRPLTCFVVGHGELFNLLLSVFLKIDLPLEGPRAFSLLNRNFTFFNTSVTCLKLSQKNNAEPSCVLERYNDVSHLSVSARL